jgi:hypothetical protein
MGVTDAVRAEGLPFLADMAGHPSMSRRLAQGYRVLTFG